MNLSKYPFLSGSVEIREDRGKLISLFIKKEKITKKENPTAFSEKVFSELKEYSNGKRKSFDIPLELSGGEFQQKVLRAIAEIPFGETKSYKEIAEKINSPKAFRAVGGALNKNPIHIILPCHRVVGAKGQLTGFAAGIELKRELLEIEKKYK